MRIFFTCLSFFIFTASFSQDIELKGKYAANFIGGEVLDFKGKDSFYFNGFYCTFGVHGKGRCEIRNNYLYLYFEKSKVNFNNELVKSPEITEVKSLDSEAILNITCIGSNDKPVAFATIQILRKGSTTMSTVSDSLGFASFVIKKNDLPIMIETSAVGFEPKSVNLKEFSGYNIRIFHKDVGIDKELNNGEVLVYEIDELSQDVILMRPENSREKFRKYKYNP